MITWDETKRQRNLREHGLDFEGCEAVFGGPVISQEDARIAYGEQRINVIGFLRGAVVILTLIYPNRGAAVHVISLRKATRHEIQRFAEELSR